ncbi:MAG: hypothetical protein FWE57_03625 [Chitinispirillia bacterium]|nr:hypothetical protein [Chitinispirillia bacterium]
MGIKSKLLFAAGLAVLTITSTVLAELEVKPYGSASYRYRGRIWNASDNDDNSASTWDHSNLVSWFVGLRAKVDDQLSLQFQIGNDWLFGENVSWAGNNPLWGRLVPNTHPSNSTALNNMKVSLAYARWNPGYLYMDVGVIPVAGNGTLDLLEKSLNTGSYNEASFLGWFPQTNNSLMAMRLGVPVLKDDIKMAAEMVVSVIDPRTQILTTVGDMALDPNGSKSNPSSFFLMFNFPAAVGDFRVTPELVGIVNRNYNRELEKGDHEILGGLSANYKVNNAVSVSMFGGYGTVSNDKSKVGAYGMAGAGRRSLDTLTVSAYNSVGMVFGAGTAVRTAPGLFAADIKYGKSYNDKTEQTKIMTDINNYQADARYTFNVHPRFTIMPRWWICVTTYDKDRNNGNTVKTKIENRPELVIGGSF